jgi:phosphoribosylanthranilate isomerase
MRVRPYIKICCIANLTEARLARAAGASALGLVSAMPSGPGVVADDAIAAILLGLQADVVAGAPFIDTFLLTALRNADALAAQHARLPSSHIQLVDAVPLVELRRLRALCPRVRLVQVIHVTGAESVTEAQALIAAEAADPVQGSKHRQPVVDMLLLDSGRPQAAVKELGGTGRVHDWAYSRQIVQQSRVPVLLAGGIHAGNAAQALHRVQPHGLDLCSSVRTGLRRDSDAHGAVSSGVLDGDKLRGLMAALASVSVH